MRLLSLAHLTVLDTTPPELVSVAAAAGFRNIGIRLTATPSVGVPPYDILSAHRAGTLSVAVTWGMAAREDLLAARPSCLVEHPSQIYQSVSALLGVERQADVREQRVTVR